MRDSDQGASRHRGGILVATESRVDRFEIEGRGPRRTEGLEDRHPTCLAAVEGRAWCGTRRDGVFRSDDGGRSWRPSGLDGEHVMSLAPSPTEDGLIWAGTEPSALWRSEDDGRTWERMPGLTDLPSSSDWSFPPKPETHHVRWITCHPEESGRLWLAIEAGALVSTPDGGESWTDRTPEGPWDTHEAVIHPERPDTLRIAAGDGYYESGDGGKTWCTPQEGLDVTYLRSVAVDPGNPDVIVVSAASRAKRAYVARHSDGRLYRRVAEDLCEGRWTRVRSGWPEDPSTIAPLLLSGAGAGEIWAADERGVHRTEDGGETWKQVGAFPESPDHLRGLARIG